MTNSTLRIHAKSIRKTRADSVIKKPLEIDCRALGEASGPPAGQPSHPAWCRARLPSAPTPEQGPLVGLRRASCASVGPRFLPCTVGPRTEGLPTHPPPGETGWQPRSGRRFGGLPGSLKVPGQSFRREQAHIPKITPCVGANRVKPLDQLRRDRKRGSQPVLALLVLSVHAQQPLP